MTVTTHDTHSSVIFCLLSIYVLFWLYYSFTNTAANRDKTIYS